MFGGRVYIITFLPWMHVRVFVHAFNFVLDPSNARASNDTRVYFLSELFGTPAHLFDSHTWFRLQPTRFDSTIRISTVHLILTPFQLFQAYRHSTSTLTHLSRTAINCRHWFFDYHHTVLTHHTRFRSHLISTNDCASCICATSTLQSTAKKSHKKGRFCPPSEHRVRVSTFVWPSTRWGGRGLLWHSLSNVINNLPCIRR